jgi:restriction endonuclease S subunit
MRIPWINMKMQEIIVPSLKEQKSITSELRDLDKSRLSALNSIDMSIKLLEEYKLSLITEYVTGKSRLVIRDVL